METPPFARLVAIRDERARIAARDAELTVAEGSELQRVSRAFSNAEIADALGITPQRVGQLRRRSVAVRDERTAMEKLLDSTAAAQRQMRRRLRITSGASPGASPH